MATIANLVVEIGGNSSKLISELKRVEKETKNLDSDFKKFAKGATKAVAAIGTALAAANVTDKIISISAEFETLKASLETVFGSQEAAALQFKKINDFASQTPFTIQEITEAAIRMKSLGLDPSTEALRSMGNTASALGKPLMQFTEAVADAVVGEFERLKEFGIKSSSEGDRVKFTFQGMTTEVQKSASAIQDYLLDIGNVQFAGAIEKQADTLAGVFSTFGGAVDNLAVKFAEETGLAQAVKDSVKWMTEFINTTLLARPSVEELSKQIETLEDKLANASGAGRNSGAAVLIAKIQKLKMEMEEAIRLQNEMTIDIGGGEVDPDTMPSPILGMTPEALEEEFSRIEESLKTKEMLIQEAAQNELSVIMDMKSKELLSKEQFMMLEQKLEDKHMKALNKIRAQKDKEEKAKKIKHQRDLLGATASFFGVMSQQSKGFAIAEAITNTWLGVSQSLAAYPMPIAAIYAASHLAAGIQAVNNIRSGSEGGTISGGGGGAAIPEDNSAILEAANEEEAVNKTVFINVEGIDDEAFLTKNQVRSIVDQINEERDANVRIVI